MKHILICLMLTTPCFSAEKPCLTREWVDAHDPYVKFMKTKAQLLAFNGKMSGEVRIYADGSAIVAYFSEAGCMIQVQQMWKPEAEFLIKTFGGKGI